MIGDLVVKVRNSGKLLAVLVVLGYGLLAFTGEMEWVNAFDKIEPILMVLLGVQGAENAVVKFNATRHSYKAGSEKYGDQQKLLGIHR